MKQRMFGYLISILVFLALFPATATAASDVTLYVGGVDIVNGGSVEGVSFDASSNTLTLDGAKIESYHELPDRTRAGIYYQGAEKLHIVVANNSSYIYVYPSAVQSEELYGGKIPVKAYGIYVVGSVDLKLRNWLIFEPGTATDAVYDYKTDYGYVLGGAIYVTEDMDIFGNSRVDYDGLSGFPGRFNFGGSMYSGVRNDEMTLWVGGDLTISETPEILGHTMKVEGSLDIQDRPQITHLDIEVGSYMFMEGGSLSMTSAYRTYEKKNEWGWMTTYIYPALSAGTISFSGGELTVNIEPTRKQACIEADALTQSGGTIKLESTGDWAELVTDTLYQSGGALTMGAAEVTKSAIFNAGTANFSSLSVVGTDGNASMTVEGYANVSIIGGGLSAGTYNYATDITVSGGNLTVTREGEVDWEWDWEGIAMYLLRGNLTVTGGVTTVTGKVPLSINYAASEDSGGFTITGGKLVLDGETAAIQWMDVSGNASNDYHVTPYVEVPITPGNVEFQGRYLNNDMYSEAFVASYMTEGTELVDLYPSNAVPKLTFGIVCQTHDWVVEPAVEPGCISNGWTEHEYCSACGEVLRPREYIEPTGHDYPGYDVKWASGWTTASIDVRECYRCPEETPGHSISPECEVTITNQEDEWGKTFRILARAYVDGMDFGSELSVYGYREGNQVTLNIRYYEACADMAMMVTTYDAGRMTSAEVLHPEDRVQILNMTGDMVNVYFLEMGNLVPAFEKFEI